MADTATMPRPPGLGAGRTAAPDSRTTVLLAWCGLSLLLLARAYRVFLLTLLVAATVPALWNWSSYVVRSGSMEPALSVGDVVVAKPFTSESHVPVGRVMIFTPPGATEGQETRVHRVVENLGRNSYTTAGDANRSDDPEPVPAKDFRAQPVLRVPFIALPLIWARAGHVVWLSIVLAITMAALYYSSRPPCVPRHRRKEISTARRTAKKANSVLRRGLVPLAATVTVVAVTGNGLPADADAAFSAPTSTRGLTWTVAAALPKVALGSPGVAVRGTAALTAVMADTGGRAYSVRIEYAAAGTTTWHPICTQGSAPYTCSWATTSVTNGSYDLRAVATSGSTTITSTTAGTDVDNASPTVTLHDPGTPLRGTVTFATTAADALSGMARVVVQYALTGSSTYTDLCSSTAAPYSCGFDTSALADGSYSFRGLATDVAGNSAISTPVGNRVVDNTVTSIVLDDPGAILSGTVSISAAASSTAGVASVRIQGATAGTTGWVDVCTDTSAPHTCTYNTNAVPDGLYDLRAVLTDGAGRVTTSATVANRRVDNTAPQAFDVQTSNGGTAGKVDAGDTMTLTYTEAMKPDSFTSGWGGTAVGVTLRLRDGRLLGVGGSGDSVDILRSGVAVNLGSVNLDENYINNNQTAQFAATMTTSTTTVNGSTATMVTIVVGAQTEGSVRTVAKGSTLTWAPSTLAVDLAGMATSATVASESGSLDREF